MGLDVQPNPNNATKESFAETALRLGGKSADEASRTGKIDMADDQVEDMFAAKYQTSASPIHRAVWQRKVPIEQFGFPSTPMEKSIEAAMQQSVSLVKRRRQDGTLFNEQRKISDETLQELSKTGYWGMLIPREYGGLGSSFRDFTRLLSRMAAADPTVAGLASVHGCIGAVDPVRTFGNAEQKQRFLPSLADGSRLSGFALTEPGAGSDLTALRTTAVLRGDQYVVNGEKLFITNVTTGRTVGLVCLIDNKPAVLVVDLPEEENESFQLKKYGLYAQTHLQPGYAI
ncbi:MAG: acyl-CoA dehydrogenase family protein [Pirellulaceae bacterium]